MGEPAHDSETAAPRRYRLLLFDLGRVLIDFNQDLIAQRLMAHARRGLPDILAFYKNTDIFYEFECGRISPEQALSSVNTMLGTRFSMEEFDALWSDIFYAKPDMERIVRQLRGRYRMFVVSDTNVLHYQFIKARFPVLDQFEEHILSFEVGVKKPDPRIFEEALRRGGVRAEEAVFIEDKEQNVEGARKLGLVGIRHRSVEETEASLKALGVLPRGLT